MLVAHGFEDLNGNLCAAKMVVQVSDKGLGHERHLHRLSQIGR